MSKGFRYTLKFKLKCVKMVVEEGESIANISRKAGVHLSILERWVRRYQHTGSSGLKRRKYQIYSPAFKLKVLKHMEREQLSTFSTSLLYDLGDNIVFQWKKRYKLLGVKGLENKRINKMSKRKKRPSTREEELLLENKSLKAELALIKKLHALAKAKEIKR